jgi:hypothetical protein
VVEAARITVLAHPLQDLAEGPHRGPIGKSSTTTSSRSPAEGSSWLAHAAPLRAAAKTGKE